MSPFEARASIIAVAGLDQARTISAVRDLIPGIPASTAPRFASVGTPMPSRGCLIPGIPVTTAGCFAISSLVILFGCQADELGAAVSCGDLEPRNDSEVVLCTAEREPVLARVALPSGAAPAGGWPGVVLLHGSSGLFLPDEHGCSEALHGRFADWADLLTERGYAVVMPASFYSRGYCSPEGGDSSHYQDRDLVTRAYDTAAAANWMCRHPQIDCSRLAVLGFSHGASVAMLVMHEDLGDAEDPRLRSLEYPPFAAGIAYYPGCGLDSQLANQLDDAQIDRYFFPTGPMWIPHAGKDALAKPCKDLRDPQVRAVSNQRGIKTDMFQLEIYPGARHGFDVHAGKHGVDRQARDDAQRRTLGRLKRWLE
jgi:dienelactone hydrolase